MSENVMKMDTSGQRKRVKNDGKSSSLHPRNEFERTEEKKEEKEEEELMVINRVAKMICCTKKHNNSNRMNGKERERVLEIALE